MRAKRTGVVLVGLLVVGLAGGGLAGHWLFTISQAPPRIDLVNQSDVDLEHVVLRGSGFRLEMARFPAHSSATAVVHVNGESGLWVSFDADSETHSADDIAYFEESGGYEVVVTIDESLDVRAKPRLLRLW